MWESFISWYINAYLGRYIENLNSQQLSFALRQGELELENVPLKKNIFRSWGLPIEVRSGVVGRIKIEFNLLKYLRNEPVLVTIEDIYLVAGPLNLAEWDPMEEEALAHETKMSSLDAHEGRWKAQFDLASNSSSYYSALYFSSMQIGASIVTKVVENLQLNVRKIHIRFEEEIGSRTRVIAFGVTLESITAQSCDSNWNPLSSSYTAGSTDCSFKTLQLNNFAVYCDTKGERFSHIPPHELKAAMSKIFTHDYLLCPVTAEARISKNNTPHPLSSASKPRFDVQLSLDKVPLQMTDSQYRNCFRGYKSFRRLHRNCRLRHYRPFLTTVHDGPIDWWRYAVRAILAVRGYRTRTVLKTWEEVLQRAKDNVNYVTAYENHLLRELLSTEMTKLKDQMETERHYEEIVALREVAMRRVELRHEKQSPPATIPVQPKVKKDDSSEKPSSSTSASDTSTTSGIFSYIFPSWTSWISSPTVEPSADVSIIDDTDSANLNSSRSQEEIENEKMQLRKSESEMDEAILDDVKSFGRDALLARFKFVLKQGMVTLNRRSGPFLELDFCGVEIQTELRPRSGSHKIRMTLASLFLRDCPTKSLLVAPHSNTNISFPSNSTKLGVLRKSNSGKDIVEPIFNLSYERKPHKKAGHRIGVTTKPLDLVIYPVLWEDVGLFFTCDESEDYLEVPHNGYEAMKQKTKEELRIYWERLLNLRTNSNLDGGTHSNWELNLDISAPQIVIHGTKLSSVTKPISEPNKKFHLYDSKKSAILGSDIDRFVVIDLGRFRFTNRVDEDGEPCNSSFGSSNKTDNTSNLLVEFENLYEDEDEDEFMTPCSSPVGERVNIEAASAASSPRPSVIDLSEVRVGKQDNSDDGVFEVTDSLGDLQAKLYKKYKLEITDVQVIVVEGKACKDGSWRMANSRCTSLLHLIDRFSINLQLDRRLIYSEDPLWPALTLVATLPKLNLHFNESKILAVQSVMNSYLSPKSAESVEADMKADRLNLSFLSGSQINLHDTTADLNSSTNNLGGGDKNDKTSTQNPDKLSNCKLFVAQFTIQQVSVEIQSRGRSIAELQITGARTTLNKRTVDTSISFIIHSLLLADAVQTFGPDFELLLASHKHVSMDSVSGSLRDSDPASPMSPQSPSSPTPFAMPRIISNQLAIPNQLHDALLSSLQGKRTKSIPSSLGVESPVYDTDALITAELVLLNSTEEDLALLSVQFNNLDVIANQETIMEILQFIQTVTPGPTAPVEKESKTRTTSRTEGPTIPLLSDRGSWKIEAGFDFNRLSILLLRGVVGKDGNQGARKIATATACDARVSCSIGGETLKIEGSLGGLQMLNLTPEGQYHQRVLSVGKDPLIDSAYNVFTPSSKPMPTTFPGSSVESALGFTYETSSTDSYSSLPVLTLRMASVIYTHCPVFLIDLKKCINQFQAPLATKLKSAAAHLALGFVRQDSLHGLYRSPTSSLSTSLDKLNVDDETSGDGIHVSPGIRLDVILDSPVIVLPRNRTSSEVLVANLGQITVVGNTGHSDEALLRSSTPDDLAERTCFGGNNPDAINYSVFICDVSLYSLNLKERWSMIDNLKLTYPTSSRMALMRAQELYYCDPSMAKPILHNTVIQFNIDYFEESPFVNAAEFNLGHSEDAEEEYLGPKLEIHGRVVNPLKVSLTPEQYSQVLDSLNNVAAGDDDFIQSELKVNIMERRMNWEKEVNSFSRINSKSPPDPMPLPSPTTADDDSLPISATFQVPELCLELVLPEESASRPELPHLSLSCSDLSFNCDKKGYITEMKVCLKSLTLEDTSAPCESQHRVLAMSKTDTSVDSADTPGPSMMSSVFHRNRYVSTSCPNLLPIPKSSPVDIRDRGSSSYFSVTSFARTESSSLPDHLDPNDIFAGRFYPQGMVQKPVSRNRRRHNSGKRGVPVKPVDSGSDICPVTPPPSPRRFENVDNLVQIQMSLIDPKSPNFISKYNGTHKFTDIDFNTLDILLTPNTFACLRRFFIDVSRNDELSSTSSAKINETRRKEMKSQQFWPKAKVNVQLPSPEKGGIPGVNDEDKNSEIQINVKALRVKLGQPSGTLAEAEVVDVTCHLVNRGKDFFGIDGRLGALQIRDVSRYAGKYPIKFIFQGKQALDFDYYRRDVDAKFRLEMASVLCVHTHRFYTEFYALLTLLFGSASLETFSDEPEASTIQPVASDPALNSVRVCLNIQAGAPVLFFPYSSSSTSLLVTDLGHLSVRNKFVEEPEAVFDCVSVDLMEMDLYSAELMKSFSESKTELTEAKSWVLGRRCIVVKTSNSSSLLNSKCALKLTIKRALSGISSPTQAGMSVQGTLSTVYATLDPEKYRLIRGLLQYNIGEKIESQTPIPTTPQRKRRQSLDNTKAPGTNILTSKLDLAIELDLVNVTVEVVKESGSKLSRIDFVKSKFTFQNYSDGTRDVDLASQEILICDNRFTPKGGEDSDSVKNVFTNILQQSTGTSAQSSSAHLGESSTTPGTKLQAEIHFRTTQRGSNVTILLNNMRLMLIMDWWMEVQSFLSQNVPEPPHLEWEDSRTEEPLESLATGIRTVSPLLNRSKQLMSPVTVSAGIVTKRAPVLDIPPTTFELRINVGDCELVAVEDPSVWDSNAVILKVTSILSYRPHLERPVSCNIITCELFSCILGLESDTALSILDPTSVSLELVRKTKSEPQGILDATLSPSAMEKILKIQSPQLSLRLSYYDMKMFVQFMERFSKQAKAQLLSSDTANTSIDLSGLDGEESDGFPKGVYQRGYHFNQQNLDHLLAMGFEREESIEVLEICDGRVEEAAIMLTSSSPLDESLSERQRRRESNDSRQSSIAGPGPSSLKIPADSSAVEAAPSGIGIICGIEIKCSSLSFCIIDDCKDADVPLVELNINQLELSQNCIERSANAECVMSGDYYNRELCGWEPFLEPWKCHVYWKQNERGQLGKFSPTSEFPTKAPELELAVTSRQIMNINITSTLLNLVNTVSSNWSEAYNHQDKRRTPFVPFILKNETGSPLWFSTILSNHEEVLKQQKQGTTRPDGTCWIQVQNEGMQTFSFEGRGKLRHRNTHQLRTHQLTVRVQGWLDSSPVSVDRVGTYFRVVKPVVNESKHYPTAQNTELPTTRLVFEVSLQGSAQKLVRVRSALMVKNSLREIMELKLENTIVYPAFEMAQTGGSYTIQVKPEHTFPIPLHSVCAQIWIRPVQGSKLTHPSLYSYCSKPLLLGTNSEGLRYCSSFASNQVQPYRFCVAIKRDEFPADTDEPNQGFSNASQLLAIGMTKRANLITLLSPLTLINLLPHEIAFDIKETGINGRISPGKKCCITNVDTLDTLDILFMTENFPLGGSIGVSSSSTPFVARLKLLDTQKRPLYLTARVQRGDGGTITVLISSQYWIVNKSGLPIMVKQEGTPGEAAGQFHEHEVCRMVAPLLYSYQDTDTASNTTLRVGNGLHSSPARPHWCKSFGIQNGTRVRKLTVSLSHSQPEVVYVVGVEVKDGKGRYRDSKLVTIAPRFVIDNRSTRHMQISQRNFATSFLDPAAEATHSTLTPGCSLPFHWPRLDKDQLLCVRLLEVKGSVWSGGFPIETVDSFHLNVRDFDGNCYFLRVEIVLEGPTYFVVFSDTDQLPPPFRIDNLSKVSIMFHQTNVGDERLKLVAKAESSCPYAWDEPTQPSNLTIAAPGGTSAIANMNTLGLVAHVTYENFFYVALSATFPKDGANGSGLGVSGMETLQLVLDVPEGTKVVLRKKEAGNRNQLWRVNGDGLIEHEGSSSPRDPRKPIAPGSLLVLDISGQASQPTQWVHLMLRKPDKRRASTQHWEFTRDGRLKCATLSNMFVQAKDGFGIVGGTNVNPEAGSSSVAAWRIWSEVVLGPPQLICYTRTDSGIPAEQAVTRQKLRPGSGRLSVYVDTDGPTRVLRIIDTERPPRSLMLNHTFEENSVNTIPKMMLTVDLHSGVGVSLVNCKPREELMYARFSTLKFKWLNSKESETLEASVENFQIDNQLLEAEKPVVIYVTQANRFDVDDPTTGAPALQLSWKRLKSRLNAHVYKTWELTVKPLNAILEERLLLKLCVWGGFNQKMVAMEDLHETDFEVQKALTNSTSLTSKRFYFGNLKIVLNQVRLSVLTSSKLAPDLAIVKRRLGLTLIRFEEALVDLDPFFKQHPFETFDFLLASLVKHYRDELLSQALLVLGSVDFLGNPVGFVNDVSVGVSGLIHEGSVGSLVRNVTHGLSNSAAKVTGSLGDGLTRTLTMDMKHEDERRKIRDDYSGSSGEQFAGGLRGLGHGVFGGLTSIITQTYDGVVNDGFSGLVTGLGKGIVGTVTKPAVGVLDFASGAASALRDSSKTSSRMVPKRNRLTRIVTGNGGLLPPYSEHAAKGQEVLYELNDRDYGELFIACETVKSGPPELKIMVSSEYVVIFKTGKGLNIIFQVALRELLECRFLEISERGPMSFTPAAPYEKKLVIEFVRRQAEGNLGLTRPQVIVDNEQVARKVVQQVNYARILYEEMRHSQINRPTSPTED